MKRFAITLFCDHSAREKREERVTPEALTELIRGATAAQKASLPWLKLARFGNARTEKGSLRHDRNVIACSGIEADYDGEKVSFDEAVEMVEKAGVETIVYTSPSHSEEAPRWRVLCPFSCELPPDRRQHMMGRINGLFRGVFAAESWTLSQAYFFGAVNHNSAHRVEVIEGLSIDQCDELDESWLGKPDTLDKRGNGNGQFHSGTVDEDALSRAIVSGESYHNSSTRLVGRWAQQGVPFLDARKRLLDCFDAVPSSSRYARWQERRADVPRTIRDIYGKEAEQRDAAGAARSDDAVPPEFSDEALALHFSETHVEELRYIAALGTWHIWDGTRWRTDDTLQALDLARDICRSASALVPLSQKRLAFAVASAKTAAAVERLARADRRHATPAGQWDRDMWTFNTPERPTQ